MSRKPPFQPLIHGVRWGTLAAGAAVAPVGGPLVRPVVTWGLILLAYAMWRTIRPLRLQGPGRARLRGSNAVIAEAAAVTPLIVEAGLAAAAIVSTGYWDSPFAFCIVTGVVAGGFTRGYGFAARLALAAGLAVSIPYLVTSGWPDGRAFQLSGQWLVELLLVAMLAGYARRVFGEAQQQHSKTMDRMTQLVEANELLVSLHRVAQQLPASLNLKTVAESTVARLRTIIESDVTAVLVRDETTARWVVAAAEGTTAGRSFRDHELPPSLASTTTSSVASLALVLEPGEGLGPELLSHSGLYAALRARGALVGLVALEHHAPGFYGRRELQLLDGFIESAGLGIDNARWFARLRAIGADEERVRIARDMHDRLGQSLAGVAFGLDRIRRQIPDEVLQKEVDELRAEVRIAVAEVRETLGDLRADVSDERGLIQTLGTFLDRVEGRTGLEVNFTHQNGARLPGVQERELWRIAQEAVTNVERHARARHLSVRWEYDGDEALLVIADDGQGFLVDRSRNGSFGLTGMRERADAIGALLEVDSAPGAGTVVRCRLGTP
ncbi:MAG: GAF domain-containing sensor histidine kinase [Acidimicrobiales bacterium]